MGLAKGKPKPTSEPQRGDVLDGRYRVAETLGKGGMGVVLAANDLDLRRQVAIKVLLPTLASDPDSVTRFMREARACVALSSEHSVRVYDVAKLQDGTPFIVMEYLVGADLAATIESRGRMPSHEATDMLLQAVEAIAEAHACGIIHRDLKPRNLFLTQKPDGKPLVKVLDFGLAKLPSAFDHQLTASLAVMGSPEYMSPEQMRGARFVDLRSDIWALGACLYELLVGRPPFSAPTIPDLIVKILHDAPLSPTSIYSDVPEALSAIVLRCLEKDPNARFANVADLSSALEPFGSPASRGAGERALRVLQRPRKVLAATPISDDDNTKDDLMAAKAKPGAFSDTDTTVELDSGALRHGRGRRTRIRNGVMLAAAFACALSGLVLIALYRLPPSEQAARRPPSAAISQPPPPIIVVVASAEPSASVVVQAPSASATTARSPTPPRPTRSATRVTAASAPPSAVSPRPPTPPQPTPTASDAPAKVY